MNITFATLRSREVVSFGVMYLSAVLRRAGHQVRLCEADDEHDLCRQLRRIPTDGLAFSVTTGLHPTYLRWAAAAKRAFRLTTLFGGPHPTFFPELVEHPAVDAIVLGEGESTTVELLAALRAGDGRVVAGAHYRLNGALIRGPLRPPEPDLDQLPWPDRDLFFDRSRFHRRFGVRSFLASRGCPYGCTYCFNRTLREMYRKLGKAVRLRSPQGVVAEIQHVRRRWRTRMVWFLDANFAVKRSWVAALSGRLRREVRLPFYCKVRPNVVDARLAELLAQGGCRGVGLGIEAGDTELRTQVLERRISDARIIAACRYLRERGIRVMSFNMVGLPGESYEMAKATVDLNIAAGVDYAMTMVFQPYPRTRLTEYAIERGLFDGNYDGLENNYYASTPLKSLPDECRRIENLQRLFALAVEFPEVRRRLDWLTAQDAPLFYAKLFQLWHHHNFYRRFYRGKALPLDERPQRRPGAAGQPPTKLGTVDGSGVDG